MIDRKPNPSTSLDLFLIDAHSTYGPNRRDWPTHVREQESALISNALAGNWRVGRSVGRTIYHDDQLVGLMDTPALATAVVVAIARAQGEAAHPAAESEGGPR